MSRELQGHSVKDMALTTIIQRWRVGGDQIKSRHSAAQA
jgi:hypothetical protein